MTAFFKMTQPFSWWIYFSFWNRVQRLFLFWSLAAPTSKSILLMFGSRFSCCSASAGDGYKGRLARGRWKSNLRDLHNSTTIKSGILLGKIQTLGPFFFPSYNTVDIYSIPPLQSLVSVCVQSTQTLICDSDVAGSEASLSCGCNELS